MVKNVVECEFGVTSAVCDYVKHSRKVQCRNSQLL